MSTLHHKDSLRKKRHMADKSSEDDALFSEEDAAEPTAAAALTDRDSDEDELERLVLGGKASFREALFRDEFTADSLALVAAKAEDAKEAGGPEDLDDAALFIVDTAGVAEQAVTPTKNEKDSAAAAQDTPAWVDSDDERLTISLASVAQRRKLRVAEGEDLISGTEYVERLRKQYVQLYPVPGWAQQVGGKRSIQRRRSSASHTSSSDGSEDEDDLNIDSASPLEKFLRDVNALNGDGVRKRRKLRPETINIQRTRTIPDQHKAAVSTLSFHPQLPILLSSSTSSLIYLHHFAPTAHPTPNPLLTSVQARGTPVRRAEFLHPHGDAIIFAGRRRYLHIWNLSSGIVKKVTSIQGHRKEQKTMERFRLSPCGRYMALIATDRKGGGMLNILSVSSMQWIAQARVNGRGGIADFAWWSNGDGLTILGRDGHVAEWSMLSKRTVGLWQDAGSPGGTVMALGGSNGPSSLGGHRWVALGSTCGILSVYDRNEIASLGEGGEVEVKPLPEPKRAFEQLTTPISLVTFSPDGQLMAFGSDKKKDALRLVHLPSCTVYSNWPTSATPLGRVSAAAFSTQSDVLAVGNDVGKIRMWEIRA